MTVTASRTSSAGSPTRAPGGRATRRRPWLGRNPIGLLLSAPYLVFVVAVFAYPLVFAVYMAFHDYFFAAPGAQVGLISQDGSGASGPRTWLTRPAPLKRNSQTPTTATLAVTYGT